MQLKNRLKRLETQIITEDSGFCRCPKEIEFHLLVPDLDNPGGYCERCRGVCALDKDAPCVECGKPQLFEVIKATFNINSNVQLAGEA